MAKPLKGSINYTRKGEPIMKADFKRLTNLMKDLGKSYSIKVGIIGSKAQEKHPDSDLTNADLGAIHEFGATINVTDKMRRYLASQGLHLKKDTTQIVIPARSFLREPLLGPDGKKALLKEVINRYLSDSREINASGADIKYLENISELLALAAVQRVQGATDKNGVTKVEGAFDTGGFGQWQPITEFTKQHRIGDSNNPPLDSTGVLKNSISYEVKENK